MQRKGFRRGWISIHTVGQILVALPWFAQLVLLFRLAMAGQSLVLETYVGAMTLATLTSIPGMLLLLISETALEIQEARARRSGNGRVLA